MDRATGTLVSSESHRDRAFPNYLETKFFRVYNNEFFFLQERLELLTMLTRKKI